MKKTMAQSEGSSVVSWTPEEMTKNAGDKMSWVIKCSATLSAYFIEQ